MVLQIEGDILVPSLVLPGYNLSSFWKRVRANSHAYFLNSIGDFIQSRNFVGIQEFQELTLYFGNNLNHYTTGLTKTIVNSIFSLKFRDKTVEPYNYNLSNDVQSPNSKFLTVRNQSYNLVLS